MYNRYYLSKIPSYLEPNKVLVIYGPRQVGKTTLIELFLKDIKSKYFFGFGEDKKLQSILTKQEINTYKTHFSNYDLIVIDEAQKIPEIGLSLKLMVDHMPNIKIIASGSSSFDLSNKLGEPLTGRQHVLELFPLSVLELVSQFGVYEIDSMLEDLLIYGTYPEVLQKENHENKIEYLNLLSNSYLYKDILELDNIRSSDKLFDLLQLLAFQIGNEVSLNELSNSLKLSAHTVAKYLDLLEKTFVIKKVRGFSRNLRKEISKNNRYYFLDNGIRNSIVNNFNPVNMRSDMGQLWENFLFSERLKKQTYLKHYLNRYFWRTYDHQEIDLIEESGGQLSGYEFKWGKGKTRAPKIWENTYKNTSYKVINRENYMDFIT